MPLSFGFCALSAKTRFHMARLDGTDPLDPESEEEMAEQSQEPSDVTFSGLVLMFGSTALVHLGTTPDPVSGEKQVDLTQAKVSIDLLDVLKTKTAGNLTPAESRLLEDLLFDLRMRYVEALRAA